MAISSASPGPRTSGPSTVGPVDVGGDQTQPRVPPRSADGRRVQRRSPVRRAAARPGWFAGCPAARRMSCWWIMLSVNAILPPNPARAVRLGVFAEKGDESARSRVSVIVDAELVDPVNVCSRPFRNRADQLAASQSLEADRSARQRRGHSSARTGSGPAHCSGDNVPRSAAKSTRSSQANSSAVTNPSPSYAHADRAGTDVDRQHRTHVGDGERLDLRQSGGQRRADRVGGVMVVDVVHRDGGACGRRRPRRPGRPSRHGPWSTVRIR